MRVEVPTAATDRTIPVKLVTDDPRFPGWRYELRMRTFRPVEYPEFIDLGTLDQARLGQATSEFDLVVVGREESRLPRLESLQCGDIRVAATLAGPPSQETIEGGIISRKYRIRLRLDRPQGGSTGLKSAVLAILTNGGRRSEIKLLWRDNGPIEVSPPRVHFGVASGDGGMTERSVLLRSSKGTPFAVTDVRSSSELVGARIHSEPGDNPDVKKIILTFSDAGSGGLSASSGEVRVGTDLPDLPVITIPWTSLRLNRASTPGRKSNSLTENHPPS